MKRILVTGGLGFIGSHLVEALLHDPLVEVVVVDDLRGSVLAAEDVLREIRGQGKCSVVLQAIGDYQPTERFDIIYHLASVVGPAAVLAHAGEISQSIVTDTYAVIDWARRSGARLVNVSTSEVYGGGRNGLCHEDGPRVIHGPASARQEYAAAKLACEVAVENLCRHEKLNAVTARPFNVAGSRQHGRSGFVLPRFLGQAIVGQPLTVFGDGRQLRAFTDPRDIASALICVAEPGETGGMYNVGNPENRISIGGLADEVLQVTGSTAGKTFVDPRTIYGPHYAEAPDKFPDATRILALGWQPRYPLRETIAATFEYLVALPRQLLLKLTGLDDRDRVDVTGSPGRTVV